MGLYMPTSWATFCSSHRPLFWQTRQFWGWRAKMRERIFFRASSTLGEAVWTTMPSATGVEQAVGRRVWPSTSTTQMRHTALTRWSSW